MNIIELVSPEELEAELQLDDDRRLEAYVRAAECESPNAPDFENLREKVYQQLCEQDWRP